MDDKDDLELMAAMLNTFIRNSFTLGCSKKTIQDKSIWRTNEPNELRKNARGKPRVVLCRNGSDHWKSYHEAVRRYTRAVRQAKVNNWKSFYETINEIPEPTRLWKILANDKEAMEEPLGFPTGGITKTPGEALGILLESHFPDARINKGLKDLRIPLKLVLTA